MKAKKITKVWLLAMVIVCLAACGKSDDKKADNTEQSKKTEVVESENLYGEKSIDEIKEDLAASDFMNEFQTDRECEISDIELIKRNTTEVSDDVYCTITVNSDMVQFIQDFEFIYNYYTTGGWVLDTYMATNEQTILPLNGVDDETIRADIMKEMGEECSYEIQARETDLNADFSTDLVYADVSIDGNLCHMSGLVTMDYVFTVGLFWKMQGLSKEENFSEYWDVDGTWLCRQETDDESMDDNMAYVLELMHDDNMTVRGNYYMIRYTKNDGYLGYDCEWEDDPVSFRVNEKKLFIGAENAAKLDYNRFYRTDSDGMDMEFERISEDILSKEEIEKIIMKE